MTDRSSSYNHHAPSSSRRASLAWAQQPGGKSGPQRGADFKGVPVCPGSPREAKHVGATSSSFGPGAQDLLDATPLHERQTEALTGLGGGKRKAQAQLTPQEDSKKARAAGTARSVVRDWPLDSVKDCTAVLKEAIDRFGDSCIPDVLEETCRDMATRLGGPAIDAAARDRLFQVLIDQISNWDSGESIPFAFMRGVMSACLPPGVTKAQVYEWLGDLRRRMDTPDLPKKGETWWEDRGACSRMLAAAAAAGGLTADEVAAYVMRQLNDGPKPDTAFSYVDVFAACVDGALGNRGDAFEDYWPRVLRVWASEEHPDFSDVTSANLDEIDDRAEALTRDWALDQIRTQSASARWMPRLLLNLERDDDQSLSSPQLCESLLARLVSDLTRAPQLPGVLLAVLAYCDCYRQPDAWRGVLRSFVQAAAPHATQPAQWVVIGMEEQWFREGEGDQASHEGFFPAAGSMAVAPGLDVRKWVDLGARFAADPSLVDVLSASDGLTEAEKVVQMRRLLYRLTLPPSIAAHWLGMAVTFVSIAFDRRMDLMAHLLECQPQALDASHFELARRQVVGQMMQQWFNDLKGIKAIQGIKDTKDKRGGDVSDSPGARKSLEARAEHAIAIAHTRQVQLSQSMLALHRAWQKGRGLEWLLRQREPGVAWVEPKRQALEAYQEFLQHEIAQLEDFTAPSMPANPFHSVLEGFLQPTLDKVDRLLALKPAGDAAPRGLDDEAPDVREPQAVKPGPASSSSSSSLS